jgi:hypothetical protein
MTDQVIGADRATGTAKLIAELDPSLRPDFLKWVATGEADLGLAVNGYSISNIFSRKGARIGICGAFTYLDALIKQPDQTAKLLELKFDGFMWNDEDLVTKQ